MSMSTTKAEYIIIGQAAKEKIYIKRFINELIFKTIKVSLKNDNKISLNFTKNPESQHQIKHIDI